LEVIGRSTRKRLPLAELDGLRLRPEYVSPMAALQAAA